MFAEHEHYHADWIPHLASSRARQFSRSHLAGLKSAHAGSRVSGVPHDNTQSRQLLLLREGVECIAPRLTSSSLASGSNPAAAVTLNKNHGNCRPFVSKRSYLPWRHALDGITDVQVLGSLFEIIKHIGEYHKTVEAGRHLQRASTPTPSPCRGAPPSRAWLRPLHAPPSGIYMHG